MQEQPMPHSISVEFHGESRSFPEGQHPFGQTASPEQADMLILAGAESGRALSSANTAGKVAVLVEIGAECLGVHTGEQRGTEGSNVLGFARFRLGTRPPTKLV